MAQEIIAVSDDKTRYVITAGTQTLPGTKDEIELGQVINLEDKTLSSPKAIASILMSMGAWLEFEGDQKILPDLLAKVH